MQARTSYCFFNKCCHDHNVWQEQFSMIYHRLIRDQEVGPNTVHSYIEDLEAVTNIRDIAW